MNLYEQSLRDSFIKAEEDAIYKNTIVSTRRLTLAWDKVWWPATVKNNMKMTEAEKYTIKAAKSFIEYCSYEMTDHMWPSIGAGIVSEVRIGNSVLRSEADILKINLEDKNKNTVIVSFTNRELSVRDAAFDNMIKATIYPFYSHKKETIVHININISESKNKMTTRISRYLPEDIVEIEKMLLYAENGIRKEVKYMNSFACKECKVCPEFKS
jgi:hypothetical protein